jgi:hypothetical protein
MELSSLSYGKSPQGRTKQKQSDTFVLRKFMCLNGCVITPREYTQEMAERSMQKAFA